VFGPTALQDDQKEHMFRHWLVEQGVLDYAVKVRFEGPRQVRVESLQTALSFSMTERFHASICLCEIGGFRCSAVFSRRLLRRHDQHFSRSGNNESDI